MRARRIASTSTGRNFTGRSSRNPPDTGRRRVLVGQLLEGDVELVSEADAGGEGREHLVGPPLGVLEQHLDLVSADSEVGEDAQIAAGLGVVTLVILGGGHFQPVEDIEPERPILGGEDVRDEETYFAAEDAYDEQELLGDRHQTKHPTLAGLGAQRIQE